MADRLFDDLDRRGRIQRGGVLATVASLHLLALVGLLAWCRTCRLT